LAVGKINKFLLQTPSQPQAAKEGIERYRQLQEQLEELSQINAQLLRREENLTGE
jgi:cell division protein FtsB